MFRTKGNTPRLPSNLEKSQRIARRGAVISKSKRQSAKKKVSCKRRKLRLEKVLTFLQKKKVLTYTQPEHLPNYQFWDVKSQENDYALILLLLFFLFLDLVLLLLL